MDGADEEMAQLRQRLADTLCRAERAEHRLRKIEEVKAADSLVNFVSAIVPISGHETSIRC